MRVTAAVLLIMLSVAAGTALAGVSTGTFRGSDGSTIVVSAAEISGIGSSTVVLKGTAHVKSFNKETKTTLDAQAEKIVVTLFSKTKAAGQSMFKSAELSGSPKMVYCTVDPTTGSPLKTVSSSDFATYDGLKQIACLKGNVKVTNENPALYEGPAVMTGDEATINLKPNLGPDEVRFTIKSSPGVSRIEVTPKPNQEAKPKK